MVVLDVWGGEGSQDHLARYIEPLGDALARAGQELQAGFLVNLRSDPAWGLEQTFDNRLGGTA